MLALSVAIMTLSGGATFAAAVIRVWRTARAAPATVGADVSPRCAVVLGHRLDPLDQPTAAYRARLDRARALAAQWPDLRLVLLGGRTGTGRITEAEAGRRMLVERGVAAGRIVLEHRSRHTLENLVHYRARLAGDGPPVLITSRFHLARASLLADGLGIAHLPCAAEERWQPGIDVVRPLLMEALLIHWYITGRLFARLTGNRRMAARIS